MKTALQGQIHVIYSWNGGGGNGCNLYYLRAGSETMVYIYATIAQARNQGGSPPRKHGPLVGPP